MGSNHEKNGGRKSRDALPLSNYCPFLTGGLFEASLHTVIVSHFTIFVHGSSCNSLCFGPIIFFFSINFLASCLGDTIKKKKKAKAKGTRMR